MKTTIYKAFSLILAFGILILSEGADAQEPKLTRQEKKAIRKAQLEENFYILDSLLNSKSFVLKADYLRNRDGIQIPVVSNLNFIKIDKETGILQTGSNSGPGYNGVGGVTAEGRVSRWELAKDPEKLSFTLRFSVQTQIGIYDVLMFIGADNHATATISGLSSGWLTWDGELYTIRNSKVFTGQETI